jgi:hypothetical protein
MNSIEEFFIPIMGVLQANPVYTVVTLLLGFSVYRWNAQRVSDMTLISMSSVCHAEESP